jgi:hypothetical protein
LDVEAIERSGSVLVLEDTEFSETKGGLSKGEGVFSRFVTDGLLCLMGSSEDFCSTSGVIVSVDSEV